MRRFLMTVCSCLTISYCLAQETEIDSLIKTLKAHPAEDTIRLLLMSDIAFQYSQEDPDKGLQMAEEMIGLAKKVQYIKFEGFGYFNRGINYWAKGNYDEALFNYKKAEEIFIKLGEVKKAANVNNSMAVVYEHLSNHSKAIELHLTNLRLYENMQDSAMIIMTVGNMGIVYNNMDQYQKAISCHERAISYNARVGNKLALSRNYGNMGNVYDNEKNISMALIYYHKALEISKEIQNNVGIANNLSNLGIVYTTAGDFFTAYKYLQLALPYYRRLGDQQNIATVFNSMGSLFLKAQQKFFESQQLNFAKKFQMAGNYFDSSLRLFTSMEDVSGQAEVWEKLSFVYEKQKKYQQSLEAHKKFVTLKDSVFNDEKKDAITRLEMNYAFAKKEDSIKVKHDKEVLIAAGEIKRQRTIKSAAIWIGTISLLAASIIFVFYKKRRDAKQNQQEAEFKTEVIHTEMKALRAQMNPHFIFNSLNSISDYIAKNDTPSADKYLGKFAKLMRMILENSEQKQVTLADDLKALELYMQLEALRTNNKFTYEINVDEAVDKEMTMVPPLILQPFVENSIWHGIAKKEGSGKILIYIKREGDQMINCIVEDDGIGRQQSKQIKTTIPLQQKTSLGMKITQARIDILNKVKNSNAEVELSDLAQGLRVEVKLPLITNF